jgi:type IV pilus biogenesis protein CpaD/CtpE
MRKRMLGALSAVVAALATGCGSSDGYDNAARPPAPVNVSVSLTADRVRISPDRLGAGPVVLLVSNQSDASRNLTLTAPDGAAGSCVSADASSGPINPQGVARIPVDLVEGVCEVGVEGDRLRPAQLTVGPQRRTAQDDLLQP